MGNLWEKMGKGGKGNVLIFCLKLASQEPDGVTDNQESCDSLPWKFERRDGWPRGSLLASQG